ncbi:MAG: calcium-binding protein, partial [Isosphaeraceae bacterium]
GGTASVYAAVTRNNNFTITGSGAGNLNTLLQTNFSNVTSVRGGNFADRFTFLDGSSLAGTVDGGAGQDVLTFDNFGASRVLQTTFTTACGGTVNLLQPGNTTGSVGVIGTFAALESIIGGQGDDSFLFGNSGSIAGGIDGGLGNNTLDYRNYTPISSTGVNVNLLTGAGTLIGGAASGRISRIRDIYGTSKNDSLTGDSQNNILYGMAGNDNLAGNDGNDMLIGGTGSDTVQGGNGYNIQIGNEINFTVGGPVTGGYGIAGQYYDFVLRSMMACLSTASTGLSADNAYNQIENLGVIVYIPGSSTQYGVQLYAANLSLTGNGTVFNDGVFDRVVVNSVNQDWVFYTTSPSSEADLVVNLANARRRSVANRKV